MSRDGLLAVFEHGVEPTQDSHGEDDIAVLPADVDIPEHVVGNAPNVVGDPSQVGVSH